LYPAILGIITIGTSSGVHTGPHNITTSQEVVPAIAKAIQTGRLIPEQTVRVVVAQPLVMDGLVN
jgi:hypothetical protein